MDNIETELAFIWLRNEIEYSDVYYQIANVMSGTDYEKANELKEFIYTLCMGEAAEINGKAWGLVCDLVNNALNTINYMQLIEANKEGEPVK